MVPALKQTTLWPALVAFLYLQVLDFLTTMVGLRLGLQEASPFVRQVMGIGPAAGVAVSKLIALALAGLCLRLQRGRLIRWINWWYAGLVVWNLGVMVVG